MPASSYASSISWTVYFAASLALVGACSPILSGMKGYACDAAAAAVGQGMADTLNGLRPGMTVSLTFEAPAPVDSMEIGGQNLTMAWCGSAHSFRTVWQLPSAVLSPGTTYVLKLNGDRVQVSGLV